MRLRALLLLLALVVAGGCALYSDVVITPLTFTPANIDRGSDLATMLRKHDYVSAAMAAPKIEALPQQNANELAALGSAEFISGRFNAARRHLRAALDLEPFRATYAQIAWTLSQLEYMSNNCEASLDWAKLAQDHGTNVRSWHIDYLTALRDVDIYHFSGKSGERVPMKMGRPDVPRINVTLNGKRGYPAMIDSGAVLSIVSRSAANALPVRPLGTFEGTFTGLLGEPIPVRFGLLDALDIGGMRIANVPVAIMPDDKMKFLVNGKTEYQMDVLLGAHLLKEFRLELNFRHGSLTLIRLTPAMRKPVIEQNLFFDYSRPTVRGTLNRRGWFVYLLDTGSEVTFLNEKELNRLPISSSGAKIHKAVLQGLGGSMKHGSEVVDVEIGLDRWAGTFRTLPMYEAEPYENTAGIIGENYLKNFDVVIDFGRMRVDLAPIGIAGIEETTLGPADTASRLPPR